MYIFRMIAKKYSLQIVTIGSCILLKTICFNDIKSCHKQVLKFIKKLSKSTEYGYTIYIDPTTIYSYKLLNKDIIKSTDLYMAGSSEKQLQVVRYYNIKVDPKNTKSILKKCFDGFKQIIYNNITNTFKTKEAILYRWPTFSVVDGSTDVNISDKKIKICLKAHISYRTVMSSNNEDLYLELTNCRVETCFLICDDLPAVINNKTLSAILKDCTIPNLFSINSTELHKYTSWKRFDKLFPPYALTVEFV